MTMGWVNSQEMAGSNIPQMIVPDNIGVELIQRGWRQGSLLKATSAQKIYLALSSVEETLQEEDVPMIHRRWDIRQEVLDLNDYLIVVSQTCDIQRSPVLEPYVEVIRAYWTPERSVIHEAAKNSVRRFLVQRRISDGGKVEGLVADMTVRISVEKSSLLRCIPLSSFGENDTILLRRFRRWLAKRYDRPALPDELVLAVQRPIVKALDKLRPASTLHNILDGIGEIVFFLRTKGAPYKIDIQFLCEGRDDVPVVTDEDASKLADWIADVIKRGGNAELVNWDILTYKDISVQDFTDAYELSLDQYSLLQEENGD